MPQTPTLANWASLLLLTVLWGSAFMFNELALMSFSPAVLVAGRVLLAAAGVTWQRWRCWAPCCHST